MKFFWHLVAADLRRLRAPLVVWVVVVAANSAMEGGGALAGVDAELRESAAMAASLLWLAEFLLMFVLVSLVVHAHPTVGTDDFWLTRPIPPRALLASKLFVLAIAMVAVPAIADAVLLGVYRVPISTAAGVVAQRASTQVFTTVLLTVAAALTANFARFALLCGAAVLSVAVTLGVFMAIETARMDESLAEVSRTAEDQMTRQFVAAAVLAIAALALLLVQYTTRTRTRSVLVGIVGAVLSYFVGALWPIPFLEPVFEVPGWATTDKLSLVVDTETIVTNPMTMVRSGGRLVTMVTGNVRAEGLEPGWSVDAFVRDASVQLPEGTTLQGINGAQAMLMLMGPGAFLGEGERAQELLGVKRVGQGRPDPSPSGHSALLAVDQRELALRAPTRGDFRANIVLNLTHHVIDGVIPLREGAAHRHDGFGLVLGRTNYRFGQLMIDAHDWRAASVFERQPLPRYSFYLRNTQRSEALVLNDWNQRGMSSLARVLPINGFAAEPTNFGFYARPIGLVLQSRFTDGVPVVPVGDDWLRDADVVIVRTIQGGSVRRTLHVPDFPIEMPKQQVVTER